MRKIKYIVVHATGNQPHAKIEDIERYWFSPVSEGGAGWKTGGYHFIVDQYGTIFQRYGLDKVTNGVKNFNSNSVHIAYIGGYKGVDTRTEAQKQSILKCFKIIYEELEKYQDVDDIKIRGHRDFSEDLNNNNVIEPNERSKECPCFDAIEEYGWLQGTKALNNNKLR